MKIAHTQSATYAIDDVLTMRDGQVWLVSSVSQRDDGRIVIGLDDPANPGKHGTAVYADVLDHTVVKHTSTGSDRAALIGNLTADLMASGWLWGVGPAESVARRLIDLGWRR